MNLTTYVMFMSFPNRLAQLRKQRGYTQETLAEAIGITKSQVYRYETGASQPTLEVIRKLALTLGVSSDQLIFDEDERRPEERFARLLESLSRLDPDEKHVVEEMIDGILLKHDAKRYVNKSLARSQP